MSSDQQHFLLSHQMFEGLRKQTLEDLNKAKEFIAEVRAEVFNQ